MKPAATKAETKSKAKAEATAKAEAKAKAKATATAGGREARRYKGGRWDRNRDSGGKPPRV